MGLFSRLKEGLTKTRQGLVGKIGDLLSGYKKIDDDLYEELEETLLAADVGVTTSLRLIEGLRQKAKENRVEDPAELQPLLEAIIADLLEGGENSLNIKDAKPAVIMVVGVNGVGKTTTIGKIAHQLKDRGHKVLLAAGDTFRAAAIEQLEIWGQRVGADIIKHQAGADPAAVAYDALKAAQSRQVDVLIVDTAGRLHTKSNLMEELKKVKRVLSREMPGAPHEVLLVLDATTGQNAISQAKIFNEAVEITGIVLTKLDGTAKGGVIIGLKGENDIPVKYIGVGEQTEDLRPFEAEEFASALFGRGQALED